MMVRTNVVAVVGESCLVPELVWASKHDQLPHLVRADHRQQKKKQLAPWLLMHCAMWSYCQRHVQAQTAVPHLFAALGTLD